MSSIQDIVTSLGINSAISVSLVAVYTILKNQPVNTRVYYGKALQKGHNVGPQVNENARGVRRYINLNPRSYLHVLDWISTAVKMPEAELIKHAGLDSAIYLQILVLGMKTFIPMMVYSFLVLVPINVTDHELKHTKVDTQSFTYSALDTITISNVENKSKRLWAHLLAAYLYTAWSCLLVFRLYRKIVDLRFKFLAAQERRPDQFTILCRCIPEEQDVSVQRRVETFFRTNHPDGYLLNTAVYDANKLAKLVAERDKFQNLQTYWEYRVGKKRHTARPTTRTGFWGLWGQKVDRLEYYAKTLDETTSAIQKERTRVLEEQKSVMPAAFVSFKSRWAAAVCAQSHQSKDLSKWLTDWAPEPRDVYWANLPIQHLLLNSRKVITMVLLVLLIVFFLIPVSFVQSLANLDRLERNVSFLKPLIELKFIKSLLQGFLPGLSLKIFLAIMPHIFWYMSSFEGHDSLSKIERHACVFYLAFMLVNVFLGNVVAGTAFEQLKLFLEKPTEIPSVLGKSIPQRSTFFITYIMVDGWTNCAIDLVRPLQLVVYYFKSAALVRTERDREKATPIGRIRYITSLPRLGFFFLLGFVYSTVSPLLLPFMICFLMIAYVVYRNHIINAYDQDYESAGRYWPVMFAYVLIGLLVMHGTLIGLMTLKEASLSTPFLLPLPCCTIIFWYYCNGRFAQAFKCYPLEEARRKDIDETRAEPEIDHKLFLSTAYLNPALLASAPEEESDSAAADLARRVVVSHESSDDSSSSSSSQSGKKLLYDGALSQSQRKLLTEEGVPKEQEGKREDLESPTDDKVLGHKGP